MTSPDLATQLRDAAKARPREFRPSMLPDLAAASHALGFPFAHIDLATLHDKDDLLAALSLALKLPEWFGHNWDALSDCLCDLSWKPAPGYVVYLEGYDAFRRSHSGDFDTLLEILEQAADYWREEGIPFWSFLAPPADGSRLLTPF